MKFFRKEFVPVENKSNLWCLLLGGFYTKSAIRNYMSLAILDKMEEITFGFLFDFILCLFLSRFRSVLCMAHDVQDCIGYFVQTWAPLCFGLLL